jgi:hypothetical protein
MTAIVTSTRQIPIHVDIAVVVCEFIIFHANTYLVKYIHN